jgi:hypothetical protein
MKTLSTIYVCRNNRKQNENNKLEGNMLEMKTMNSPQRENNQPEMKIAKSAQREK